MGTALYGVCESAGQRLEPGKRMLEHIAFLQSRIAGQYLLCSVVSPKDSLPLAVIPYFSSRPEGFCSSQPCAALYPSIGYTRQFCRVKTESVEFQTMEAFAQLAWQSQPLFVRHPDSHRYTVLGACAGRPTASGPWSLAMYTPASDRASTKE